MHVNKSICITKRETVEPNNLTQVVNEFHQIHFFNENLTSILEWNKFCLPLDAKLQLSKFFPP